MNKPNNYSRFFSLVKKVPGIIDAEEFRRNLIWQCTDGRATSLKELTTGEYNICCLALEKLTGMVEKRKKLRSQVLKQMQQLHVDTTDWAQINSFCQQPRIAGKAFARLSIEELESLSLKLRVLKGKGWERKPDNTPSTRPTVVMVVPTTKNSNPS
ncbi:MAG: hypothetical protein K6E86_02180 [Bacteroidales bacterium]|nr:hypothetical protein [Bacteroidales bacterium]